MYCYLYICACGSSVGLYTSLVSGKTWNSLRIAGKLFKLSKPHFTFLMQEWVINITTLKGCFEK